MQTDLLFLIATTVGIGGIIGGVVAPMLQAHPIAQDLFVGFWLVFLAGLWAYHFRAPLLAGAGRFGYRLKPSPSAAPQADEWLTLADAARAALSEASTLLDATTRGMAKDEGRLLAIWAYRVTAQIGVPLYGSRVMSSRRQIVPMEEPITFRDDATRVSVGNGGPTNDFVNLMVKRSDLETGLAEVNRPREPGE